ncbi:MAG: CHAT domain-containing protein [Microcoleus sp.]
MLVNTIIVEQLDADGRLKTLTMQADRDYALWVALADEYDEPREGPFYFPDPRYAKRFSREFEECPALRVGKTRFRSLNGYYEFCTCWRGIPKEDGKISYYALSLPENAIPDEICIEPQSIYREAVAVTRDEQKKCFVIYLEYSPENRYFKESLFSFELKCKFYLEKPELFSKFKYKDRGKRVYGYSSSWKGMVSSQEVSIIQNFLGRGELGKNNKVILHIEGGSLRQGFRLVSVQIFTQDGQLSTRCSGKLPGDRYLENLLKKYRTAQLIYQGSWGISSRLDKNLTQVKNFSTSDLNTLAAKLEQQLNKWLSSAHFIAIDRILREKFNPSDEVQVIIQSENRNLRNLPWHLWEFCKSYRHAEIALSVPFYDRLEKIKFLRNRIRILSVLGDDKEINIDKDRQLLAQIDAETVFIVKPNRQELDRQLWSEQSWDILCFSGHSSSEKDGSNGWIYINDTDKLSIPELKNALQTAIERGLQIAIFNSCDGLGLANQLAQLHIPQIIVFREPVPDVVAQEFLKNFLTAFASGKSFYLAVREARERLQSLEDRFPCASWLPVICQNPAEVPPTWYSLQHP